MADTGTYHFAVLTHSYAKYVAHLEDGEYTKGYRYACGLDPDTEGASGNLMPKGVDCPDCLASAEYQELLITIEIGYDGSPQAWWSSYGKIQQKEPKDTLP